ncbi:Galectin-3 [Merluccius polli]|uniref:Galectin n=1 Tax=Merluccius polli TaxID=89951 RepID=A0AA47NVY2_MERPO|nr:Galectin-3 [Merluccius polli]
MDRQTYRRTGRQAVRPADRPIDGQTDRWTDRWIDIWIDYRLTIRQRDRHVVPYKQTLPSGVYDKLLITIKGTVKPQAHMMTMDLSTPRDIAFHFNVRFNEAGKKVIVRNNETSKKWGKEERDGQFPFVHGKPFEMKVLCTNQAYRVAVNGSHLLEFHHRNRDLRSINNMAIHGDLTLSAVQLDRLP